MVKLEQFLHSHIALETLVKQFQFLFYIKQFIHDHMMKSNVTLYNVHRTFMWVLNVYWHLFVFHSTKSDIFSMSMCCILSNLYCWLELKISKFLFNSTILSGFLATNDEKKESPEFILMHFNYTRNAWHLVLKSKWQYSFKHPPLLKFSTATISNLCCLDSRTFLYLECYFRGFCILRVNAKSKVWFKLQWNPVRKCAHRLHCIATTTEHQRK